MKQLFAILCLSAALAAPRAATAGARENGRGRGAWASAAGDGRGNGWGRGGGGGVYRAMPAGGRNDRVERDRGGRVNPGRGNGRVERDPPREYQDRSDRQYRNVRPDDGGRFGRGDYLPDTYRGERVPDPGSFHLRTAPPGYSWMRVGDSLVLMQQSTGRILESVPGGDAPPPRGRGRR